MGLAGVSTGTTVVSIFTAHSLRDSTAFPQTLSNIRDRSDPSTDLWQRAAPPLVALLHEAAGCVSGAAGLSITLVFIIPSLTGALPHGRELLLPWQTGTAGSLTGLLRHVALVAFGAAVLQIRAAHSLEEQEAHQLQHDEPDPV